MVGGFGAIAEERKRSSKTRVQFQYSGKTNALARNLNPRHSDKTCILWKMCAISRLTESIKQHLGCLNDLSNTWVARFRKLVKHQAENETPPSTLLSSSLAPSPPPFPSPPPPAPQFQSWGDTSGTCLLPRPTQAATQNFSVFMRAANHGQYLTSDGRVCPLPLRPKINVA